MPDPLDRLIRRLSVAAEVMLPDERTLTDSIYQQRAAAWRDTLTQEARAVGSGKTGQGPSGGDAQYLRDVSRDDARSVRATYQRELENQIRQLYAANPDGDRAYYISNLTTWADQRADYKDRQIATMNRSTTRTYAQLRFEDENRVQDATFRMVGPSPREQECADLMAAGVVSRRVKEANPTPIHINCVHSWERQGAQLGVDIKTLWTG